LVAHCSFGSAGCAVLAGDGRRGAVTGFTDAVHSTT
jgi:hypothetical protein